MAAARTKGKRGFADYLAYSHMAAPGVVELKNGSYLLGYRYIGPDFESSTREEIEHISAMSNSALRRLGNGWMIHFEAIRRISDNYPDNKFTEPTNILIDQEREIQHKAEGTHFETAYYIFFTYLPPAVSKNGVYRRIINFFSDGEAEKSLTDEKMILDSMQTNVTNVLDIFGQEIRMRRLGFVPDLSSKEKYCGEDELLTVLNYIINGHWHPVYLTPTNTAYLDVLLARDLITKYPLQMEQGTPDAVTIPIVSVISYPLETFPNMLEQLLHLPWEMRWSNRFIFSDFQRSKSILDSNRKKWVQKIRSFIAQITQNDRAPVNQDALDMVDDIDSALKELNANWIAYGQHTSVVLARARTKQEAEHIAHETVKVFEKNGFSARIETLNAFEALLGSFPGHGYENVRKPYINTLNLVDIVPLTSEWTGEPYNPSPEIAKYYKHVGLEECPPALLQATSLGSTPFRLNIHVSDLGHTLVLGPSGSGKSTLLSLIVSQFERYKDAQIFCFDKGYSMFPLCAALQDSVHYDLGRNDSTLSLCPLAELDTVNDIGSAAEWLESMLILQGGEISPQRRNMITETLKILADSTASLDDPASHRTITDFLATLQDEDLRQIFTYYSVGNTGEMLDGKSNDIKYAKTTVFELEHLFNMDSKIVIPVFVHIFQQIEKRILSAYANAQSGRPSLIVIDEAWLALSNPIFAAKIKEWLKVLRKNNCAVILATQSLNDIVNSPIMDAVLDSCETRILLPNPNALSESMKELYMRHLALNEQQVEMIAHAEKKREYYYACETLGAHRLFSLALGHVALSFVGASGKEDLARIRELEAEHGKHWPEFWLTERKLPDAAHSWRVLYDRYRAENGGTA